MTTKTAPLPLEMRWVAAPDFGDETKWYVVCFLGTNQFPTFIVMASGLTQMVAKHIVALHNARFNHD